MEQVPPRISGAGTCSFFILVAGLLLLPLRLESQQLIEPATDLEIFGTSTFEYRQRQTDISDVQGTPYLEEGFSEGSVLIGQTLYQGIRMRYNVYNDRFEVKLKDQTIEMDPVRNGIDTIFFHNGKFVVKILPSGGKDEITHLEVLFDRNGHQLYKHYRVTLVAATNPGAYSEAKPAEFRSSSPDYYMGRGEEMIPFRGLKSLSGFFRVPVKEVRSFAREKELDTGEDPGLVILFGHFSENE